MGFRVWAVDIHGPRKAQELPGFRGLTWNPNPNRSGNPRTKGLGLRG